jgi:hypothetical protein
MKVSKWEQYRFNKSAFMEVFGNKDNPGAYIDFKTNSTKNLSIYVEGGTTRNPAQPCRADFCCDVENVLNTLLRDKALLKPFFSYYVLGLNTLDKKQRRWIEQTLGQELRNRNLVPVINYFKIIRK